MKNILLTGASGFVGTNILSSQLLNNYEILCPSSKELNLLNRNSISQYFTKESPDLVIHAAGKVGGILKNSNSNYNFLLDNSLMAI
ncbi:MAG: NAD-dependent epimerase/dehydratase family protein, partial [Flavobacteriaceae bacterium]|nr:NAD-dependent epimerase/dehydratase family protein [Flavobacteriaceae bacterium]